MPSRRLMTWLSARWVHPRSPELFQTRALRHDAPIRRNASFVVARLLLSQNDEKQPICGIGVSPVKTPASPRRMCHTTHLLIVLRNHAAQCRSFAAVAAQQMGPMTHPTISAVAEGRALPQVRLKAFRCGDVLMFDSKRVSKKCCSYSWHRRFGGEDTGETPVPQGQGALLIHALRAPALWQRPDAVIHMGWRALIV